MNTPTHLAIATLTLGKRANFHYMPAVTIGAFAPDILMFVLGAIDLARGYSFQQIFDVNYFTPRWQIPIDWSNSFLLYGVLLALAAWRKWPVLIFFSIAALLHLLFDLPVHQEDAHAHFYPLSGFRYISPVSYWDTRYYGDWIMAVEMVFLTYAAFAGRKYYSHKASKVFYTGFLLFMPIASLGFVIFRLFS